MKAIYIITTALLLSLTACLPPEQAPPLTQSPDTVNAPERLKREIDMVVKATVDAHTA